jgi:hypothetical protein
MVLHKAGTVLLPQGHLFLQCYRNNRADMECHLAKIGQHHRPHNRQDNSKDVLEDRLRQGLQSLQEEQQ